jgi:hypothetical protein
MASSGTRSYSTVLIQQGKKYAKVDRIVIGRDGASVRQTIWQHRPFDRLREQEEYWKEGFILSLG